MEVWKKFINFLSSDYYATFFYQTETSWGITSVTFRALGVNESTIGSLVKDLKEKDTTYKEIVLTNIIKL